MSDRDMTKWAKEHIIECLEKHISEKSTEEDSNTNVEFQKRCEIVKQLKRMKKFLGGR